MYNNYVYVHSINIRTQITACASVRKIGRLDWIFAEVSKGYDPLPIKYCTVGRDSSISLTN